MKYYYKVYGLTVESDIVCDELVLWDERLDNEIPDVIIELGELPVEVQRLLEEGKTYQYESDLMWFKVPNIATYCISKGKTVSINKDPKATVLDVKQFLLGSCLGMIMLQRDMIAIHGGTVVINEKGLLITGERGAGKSTLTSTLREKGYPLLADDVSAFKLNEVQPAYPQQKVCEDMMELLGYNPDHYRSISLDSKKKYLIPVKNQFNNQAKPVQAIIELIDDNQVQNLEVKELKGTEKLMTIYRNIYRIEMKMYAGINPDFLKRCVELAQEVLVYQMRRPRGKWSVDHQIEWIEQQFMMNKKLEA